MRWNPLQVDLRSKKEFLRRKRQKSGISFYVICDDVLSFWPWQEKEIIRRSYRVPFVTLYPQSYSIHLNNLDPQSVVFVDIIDYFKDYFPSIYEWDVQIYFAAGHQTTSRRDMHYRSVRYWLDQQRGDVPEFPKYFYHGTCSELWYEGVASEGLKPRLLGHGGSSGSFGAGGALSMEDRVYISIHPDNAAREAAFQAAQKHGGLPLILRIKSDLLDPTNLVPDEDAHAEDVIQNAYEVFGCNPPGPVFISLREMGTCAYVGSIPSDALEPFVYCTSKHQSDKCYRWVRWDNPPRMPHPITEQIWESLESRRLDPPPIHLDDPAFYALYDAGIVEMYQPPELPSGHRVGARQAIIVDEIDDRTIKDILKTASWASDAAAIGHERWDQGINSLNELVADVTEPELQLLVELLVKNKFFTIKNTSVKKYGPEPDYEPYEVSVDYLNETYRYGDRKDIFIALAKDLHKNGLSYSKLLELIKHYHDNYPRYYRI